MDQKTSKVKVLDRRAILHGAFKSSFVLACGLVAPSLASALKVAPRGGPDQILAVMRIEFPPGYTHDQYEKDVPLWVKNSELRSFVRSSLASGSLSEMKKTPHASGVNYEFRFPSKDAFKEFENKIDSLGLVNRSLRSSFGLRTTFDVSNRSC